MVGPIAIHMSQSILILDLDYIDKLAFFKNVSLALCENVLLALCKGSRRHRAPPTPLAAKHSNCFDS